MFIININPWVYSSILMYINESKQEKGMNMIADVIFTNHYLREFCNIVTLKG